MDETVLVIDPDEVGRLRLARPLRDAKFEVIEATGAIEGLFETLERNPDLILLAEEVPPLEAGDLLPLLRRLTAAPIMVFGSGGDPEEIAALDLGADFYERRPPSAQALIARARALLRRYRASLTVDPHILDIKDYQSRLSPTEKRLLACLMVHKGRPVSPSDLVIEAYGGAASASTVKVALWRLRRKLGPDGLAIVARPGVGYRLVMDKSQYAEGQKAG